MESLVTVSDIPLGTGKSITFLQCMHFGHIVKHSLLTIFLSYKNPEEESVEFL
jgi:hypothetical protein